MQKKLTIGMPTYDDFDGIYFTIQAIRLYHQEVLDNIEFVIINNNPKSEHSKALYEYKQWIAQPVNYVDFESFTSTTVKDKVFAIASTPYVMCIDSHILLEPGSIKQLIDFFDSGQDDGNLLQGPLIYDDLKSVSTHFDLSSWGQYMWGKWATDDRGTTPDKPPFEIPAQGTGLLACRKDSWLGFNEKFRGFGGEEGYIHEKYRKAGKKTLCLPFLRWMHRFKRPAGLPYPNNIEDRFRNYIIGFTEMGLDTRPVLENFSPVIPHSRMIVILKELQMT